MGALAKAAVRKILDEKQAAFYIRVEQTLCRGVHRLALGGCTHEQKSTHKAIKTSVMQKASACERKTKL